MSAETPALHSFWTTLMALDMDECPTGATSTSQELTDGCKKRNSVGPKVVTSTLFTQILLFLWEEELMCGQNYLHIAIRRQRDHSY